MNRFLLKRRLMGFNRCYLNQLLLPYLDYHMEAFKGHHVIPDVIDKLPKHQLKVHYPYSNVEIDYGNILKPIQVKDEPKLEWPADSHKFYTVLMTDPDAPSRSEPKFREWQHWLVVNIPGNEVNKGDVKTPYIGARPPQGTGLHRYVLHVYEQKGRLDFEGFPTLHRDGKHRANFNTREFIKSHEYESLVAANFFQTEWDEDVTKMHHEEQSLH